jgi:hypothetical protein
VLPVQVDSEASSARAHSVCPCSCLSDCGAGLAHILAHGPLGRCNTADHCYMPLLDTCDYLLASSGYPASPSHLCPGLMPRGGVSA